VSASLDAAGIGNHLFDAYTVGLVWTYSTALGWMRLYVSDSDLEKALQALEPGGEIEWPSDLNPEEAEERCPVCGSADLAIESGARKTLALWLITQVPVWFWRSKLRCRMCGSSQRVPLRFRPELVAAWVIVAVVAYLSTVVVLLLAGFIIHGRA
jgi:hypothetical protein